MEGQPLVSIVIPAYNAEKTLKRMLDSVTGQTWQNTQIILVDDGSRDNTLRIAREAAERDARIQVHTQENRGVSQARNMGMRFCTGKYIRFLDADDTLPPESTEILVNKAEKEGSDLVIGGYKECLGTREFRFFDLDRVGFVAEGVTGNGFAQFRNTADIAGMNGLHTIVILTARNVKISVAFFNFTCAVPHTGISIHDAGIDTDEGLLTDERVSGGLPHISSQRFVISADDLS